MVVVDLVMGLVMDMLVDIMMDVVLVMSDQCDKMAPFCNEGMMR